jgi:hypothetical protein
MSGNISIYDELKKNDQTKKRAKLKFITAVAMTNILVALASYSLFSEPHADIVSHKISEQKLHPHFKMIVAPLKVLVENNEADAEVPVSLIDKDKKVLVRIAYLHSENKSPGSEKSEVPHFKIEIPEEDVLKLSADESTPMIAIPQLQKELSPKAVNKRVSKYEINF